MFTRQVPASTILLHGQFMAGDEMSSEHLSAPAAFQANDIIAMNRSSYRDGRCPLAACFWWLFSETCEGLINGRDESSELVRRDLIAPNIGGDNFSREFSIDGGGRCIVG